MNLRVAALALAGVALAGCVRTAPAAGLTGEEMAAEVEKWRVRAGVPAAVDEDPLPAVEVEADPRLAPAGRRPAVSEEEAARV